MLSIIFLLIPLILRWAIASPVTWAMRGNATFTERSTQHVMQQPRIANIKRMAALGDSYSAGIGAGNRLGNVATAIVNDNWQCSRYDSSYPYLLHNDARLGDPGQRNFQFRSCSGAVIDDVLNKQLPNTDGGQDVILISAGGNDLGLVALLNQCVFQWAALTSVQVVNAKAAAILDPAYGWASDFDWDSLSRGCDGQLDHTENTINSPGFSSKLASLLSAAKGKLGPGGIIYYTGYAKFFAEDMSPECDKVTWSTWIYRINPVCCFSDEYLIRAHRQRMNALVDKANLKIREAVAAAGPQVKFIDYDKVVGDVNGRFCEAGVDEASKESNGRPGLMFYELDIKDRMGDTPWKRSDNPSEPGTFKADIDIYGQIALLADSGATIKASGSPSISSNMRFNIQDVHAEAEAAAAAGVIPNVLPDGYGRVFHPTKLLHGIIAQHIIWEMMDIDYSVPEVQACVLTPGGNPSNSGGGGSNAGGPPSQGSTAGSGGSFIGSGGSVSKAKGQQVALASYINPTTDKSLWDRMIGYPSDKVSVLVANVLNGPDSAKNQAWDEVISAAHGQGKTVLGYVRTGYLGVSHQQFKTMLGSGDLADWIAQIEQDIEAWYRLYPGKIGGIFLDEGWNECGADNIYANTYKMITDNTKRKHPGAYIVLNPGWFMPQCFEESADTLMTFESSYQRYLDRTETTYKSNGWTPKDHRKLWHIVYEVPQDKIGEVVSLAKERHAGLLHITDATLPNPYNVLPNEAYMKSLMDAVDIGGPSIAEPHPHAGGGGTPSTPGNLRVAAADYTSVKLEWNAPANAETVAVYQGDAEIARVLGHMNRVTIGFLPVGEKGHKFRVRATGRDGTDSGFSNTVTADTKALPDGKPIINVKVSPSPTETIFEADVLVPYAFIRIMVTEPDSECSEPSYPINTPNRFVCAKYMIEGETSYKYAATAKDPKSGFWPWKWSPTKPLDAVGGNMKVERDVYHYKWTLPIGTDTLDTKNIVIQGEGVSPRTDVFLPCPCSWESEGLIGKDKDKDKKYCEGKPKFCPFNCQGHALCSTSSVKWCDKAVNQMTRGGKIYRSNGALAESGNCWANNVGLGCSVLIRGKDAATGKNCEISGDDLWLAYQDIKDPKKGNCGKCGSKHFGNGCLVSIDYYEGCDNRDSGINRMVLDFDDDTLGGGMTLGDGVFYGSMIKET